MNAPRSALVVERADAAAFAAAAASGADAWIVDAPLDGGDRFPANAKAYWQVGPSWRQGADAPALERAARLGAHGFALPLAGGGADVQRLGARLAVVEARLGLADGALRILAFAAGTPEATLALDTFRGASARLDGLVFAAADLRRRLCAPGRPPARAAAPLRLARSLTLIAARAAGVFALDAAAVAPESLRAEAEAARDDGFDGKLVRDSRQVAAIHSVFADGL